MKFFRNPILGGGLHVLSLSTFVLAFMVGGHPLKAGLIVTGEEVAAGMYQFTVDGSSGPPDAIQNRNIIDLAFAISLPGLTLFSPGGSFTDGTETMNPALSGWTSTGLAFNPNLVAATILTATGDAGVDVTTIPWNFVSAGGPEWYCSDACRCP